MERLPSNCVLDKGRTGCGATTLAIMQQGNAIIAVPYVNLIKSKESQHSDILLGESRVKALKYKVTDIRRELVKVSTVTETEKIIRMVRQSLPYRKAVPRREIADALQEIYDTLGIRKTAVATDLAK